MKDSFELNLQLESAEAKILHLLLTQNHYNKKESEQVIVQNWNFYGQAFVLDKNALVTIQDLSSLISLNIINNTLATALFNQLGYSGHEVRTFLDSLADWKDKDDLNRLNGAERIYYRKAKQTGPRNGYLQNLKEVEYIRQGHILTTKQWRQFFTTQIVTNFNPLNAPEFLLKAFINDERAFEEVLKQRNLGMLTALSFYQTTSIEESEYISFNTGTTFKVSIMVDGQNNKLSKDFIVDLRPRSSTRPIIISQLTWNQE